MRLNITGNKSNWIVTYRLVKLLPDADGLIVGSGHDKFAMMTDGKCPNFSVMAIELLYILELEISGDSGVSRWF